MAPLILPPSDLPGRARLEIVRPGTLLQRIHLARFGSTEFNPTVPSAVSGGRFDTTDGRYAYLYAASHLEAAVAEAFLPATSMALGKALLPKRALQGRVLSILRTTEEVALLSLHGSGLAMVGADQNLTMCDADGYPVSRLWAGELREWVHDAQGFVWRSRRDNDHFCYVFFSDRCHSLEAVGDPVDLDDPTWTPVVLSILRSYNVSVDA